MKKILIVFLIFAFFFFSCSKEKNKNAVLQNDNGINKVQLNIIDEKVSIEVYESISDTEIQNFINSRKINLSKIKEVSIELNNYTGTKSFFQIEHGEDFLRHITVFYNRNFELKIQDYIFEGVKELFLNLFNSDNLEKISYSFPNVETLCLNDFFSENKIADLSFLYNFNKISTFEIYTGQSDCEIYNKMISNFSESIYDGKFHTYGIIKIYGKLGFPLCITDSDIPQDLENLPSWYTGKDISGIPSWCNVSNMTIYEKPSLDSHIISQIEKNKFCTIKTIMYDDFDDGEISVFSYFPYENEEEFNKEMKFNKKWFKVHTEDNDTGYVLGENLRLSY